VLESAKARVGFDTDTKKEAVTEYCEFRFVDRHTRTCVRIAAFYDGDAINNTVAIAKNLVVFDKRSFTPATSET
jgi:hypothetical protein